jgi:hypothetical protein
MSFDIIDSGKRKARKEYKCDLCNLLIGKGELYNYENCKLDGELYTWRMHEICAFVLNNCISSTNLDNDAMTQNEFVEYVNEFFLYELSLSEKIQIIAERNNYEKE